MWKTNYKISCMCTFNARRVVFAHNVNHFCGFASESYSQYLIFMEMALFTLRFINNKVTTHIKALCHLHFVTCIEDVYIYIFLIVTTSNSFASRRVCVCLTELLKQTCCLVWSAYLWDVIFNPILHCCCYPLWSQDGMNMSSTIFQNFELFRTFYDYCILQFRQAILEFIIGVRIYSNVWKSCRVEEYRLCWIEKLPGNIEKSSVCM